MCALLSNYFLGEKMQLRKVAIGLIVIASLSTLTACGAGENAAARNACAGSGDGHCTDPLSGRRAGLKSERKNYRALENRINFCL